MQIPTIADTVGTNCSIMIMKSTISSYQDAIDIQEHLATCQMGGWHLLYRSHANENFELLPTIGRRGGDLQKRVETNRNTN